jgi:hypothetical protein
MLAKPLPIQSLDDVVHAITMRINFIETGTTIYNAHDAKRYNDKLDMSDSRDRARVIPINPLSREQRDMIARLEDARSSLQQEIIDVADADPEDVDAPPAEAKRQVRTKDKKLKKRQRS